MIPTAAADPRIRAFVVDDSPMFLDTAGRILGADPRFDLAGVARSGEEALEVIPRLRPDLVLMDLMMQGMNGLTVTRHVKGLSDPPAVIVLTLHDSPEYRAAATAVGADGFMAKPDFSPELILSLWAATQHRNQAEARYRSLVEAVPVGLALTTPEGRILEVNPAFVALFRFPNREAALCATAWDLYVDPEDRRRLMGLLARDGIVRDLAVRLRRHDGEPLWAEINAREVHDATGRTAHYDASVRDVTAMMASRQESDSLRNRLAHLLIHSPAVIYCRAASGSYQITEVSENASRLLGYDPRLFLEDPGFWADRIHAEDAPRVFPALENLSELEQLTLQYRFLHGDGTYHHMRDEMRIVRDPQGHPVEIVGALSDLSDRERLDAVARESEERYSHLFELNPIPSWIYDPDTLAFLDINSAAIEQYGYSRDEFSYMTVQDLCPAETVPGALEGINAPDDPVFKAPVERHQKKNGEIILVEVTDYDFPLAGRRARRVLAVDVSERVRAEEALRDRERFLSSLNDITAAAAAEHNFSALLKVLADHVRDLFRADDCYIVLWDDVSETPVPAAVSGPFQEEFKRFRATRGSPSATALVLQTGRGFIIEDVESSPYINLRLTPGPPIISALILPLIAGSQRFGAAIVSYAKPRRFTAVEVARGEQAARQAALAMAKARLLEEAAGRARELEVQLKVSSAILQTHDMDSRLDAILSRVMEVVSVEYGAIFLVEDGLPRLRSIQGMSDSLREALLKYVGEDPERFRALVTVREGHGVETLPEHARQEGLGAWATVPLWLPSQSGRNGPRWLGTIVLCSRDAKALSEEQMRAVDDLSLHVSLAIGQSQASQMAEQRLARMQALHDIDMAITSTLDLRVVLNVLLTEVSTHLLVDASAVLLLSRYTQSLECAARRGVSREPFNSMPLRLEGSHAGRAVLEQQSVHVADLSQETSGGRMAALVGEGFVGYMAVPLVSKGQVKGVLELYSRTPLRPDAEWMSFLETLATQAAVAIDSAATYNELQQLHSSLTESYENTLEGWVRALDLRDEETEGHTQRVTEMTVRLAQAMGISEAELVHIRRGALLHDIGKMAMPDSVLLKPGPLTDAELEVVRQHPVNAYAMLSPIPFLRPALAIPYSHHEKWDGTGYPHGTSGEQIPLAARVFAVVDVWDALRSERPYRAAWPEEKVRSYLLEQAGTHFDPRAVDAFLKMLAQLEALAAEGESVAAP